MGMVQCNGKEEAPREKHKAMDTKRQKKKDRRLKGKRKEKKEIQNGVIACLAALSNAFVHAECLDSSKTRDSLGLSNRKPIPH
jgi:predicted ATPase